MTRLLLCAAVFTLMVCLPMQAESMAVKANIPFDFHIGSATLPAGRYMIKHDGNVLQFRQQDGGNKAAAVLTQAVYLPDVQRTSKLTFNRYSDEYFLSGVSQVGMRTSVSVPKNKREKELIARSNGSVQTAGVVLPAK